MKKQLLSALFILLQVLPVGLSAREQVDGKVTRADVLVYGSTPGGVCAAIAASREGASVILLEPTGHVGGLNTGGLSFSDSNQTVRSTLMGLFDEWHTRIEQDYAARGIRLPYQVRIKDQSKWTYEPHVAQRVTNQMLKEANVKVLTKHSLQSVTKEGTRITSLAAGKANFAASTFIDATYEGDLMAAAGVSWTIGREGKAEFGESLAGKRYPKSRIDIDGFDSDGQILPFITTTDAGPEEEGDSNVMVYSFRLCLTEDPANRVPFPKPDHYDPARFEVMRRFAKAGGRLGWDLYPLPGGKLDGNNSIGGQFSLGLVGAGNGWSEADAAGRVVIWEKHKQYTLEFYHFLTTDPAVPEKIRKSYARLGLCKDEFPEYGHFSPALYVREGRRMRGMYVLSQKDILEEPEKQDPIAVSSFPIDSHDCQRIALKDGGVINEGTIFPVRKSSPKQGYAYHVPYRSLLPQPEECSNLIVPVALSCTHVGISSLRVEPTWMILGQSAGVAAALSARKDVSVQELPYKLLRDRLLAQGQVLELPPPTEANEERHSIDPKTLPGIVLDNQSARLSGHWSHSTNFKPHIGKGYLHDEKRGDGKAMAVFRFKAPQSGRYQILLAYSAHETRAKNVPLTVSSGTEKTTLVVDQTKALPQGKQFRPLGIVDLEGNTETTITMTNDKTNGFVILDALQLLPVK
ncbi:FAD-dependent oxidoreductase [Gimesia sp.]|uniref:FAD-dependent oxidoreductase n=1 Tax=Gimesia sp. TaxID=2024833 RepID=UPI000C641767|nr:FAD-dependent oxidoreductase [Gimesia sp.]MAX37774.1 xanthan lyase [Gimesia sp.]